MRGAGEQVPQNPVHVVAPHVEEVEVAARAPREGALLREGREVPQRKALETRGVTPLSPRLTFVFTQDVLASNELLPTSAKCRPSSMRGKPTATNSRGLGTPHPSACYFFSPSASSRQPTSSSCPPSGADFQIAWEGFEPTWANWKPTANNWSPSCVNRQITANNW